MWGAPEEPPDAAEGAAGTSQPVSVKEICEDNKSQLETFKDIMLKNKNDLKRKEEELQEYASKLSEIKSRTKLSRRSKDGASASAESTLKSRTESSSALPEGDVVDDISQAKTPKAKSSLLQRKLAENRKVFEKRSKEMTASKRAVEEKVEAIRQQMDQTDMTMVDAQRDSSTVTPVRPVLITQLVSPPAPVLGHLQDKDNKIAELSNRILELEATVIDLQDNLKEKDSVIESKTLAVTLMSADLSKKGKTTLDTLEDTKDEMRTMQENFVLIESSLKGKNENLLEQLQERNDRVAELESTISRYQQEKEEKRLADSASESLSRSTMDTLADTKDAMRSMQENFVLIETSLKDKIDNLLQQLQDRETRLAEAEEKIHKFETGAGIVAAPEIPDLRYKIERLERSNRALQDEKYELQKSNAELQEKIVAREATNGNGLIIEKDNRIAELENLIEELRRSNQLLEEESKAELQKQVVELATANDEFRVKIDDLERINNDLEIKMSELRAKASDESDGTKDDAAVKKLTKELDDLNKSMIKLKAQHKGKLRNLQKQLESFKAVSDANAELVKLGNQVALLEEEKASAGDWQDRVADLESRLSTQTNDIQAHVEAIAILENQKLDLMQELHTAKQEISALEAENAESENLRVTAEMKVVDLEEQLESHSKSVDEPAKSESDLLNRIEHLTQENRELVQKVAKLEEKPSSDAGSTESFETIHEDRNVLQRKIETLSSRSAELEEKLAKSEEKLVKLEEGARSNVGSTESFETINDTDRSELMKKIDLLSRENSDLVTKLNKYEEKTSSDTGSTESFEKIPEHVESPSRIEILTRENNELVIKLTKIEEKYEILESRLSSEAPRDSSNEASEMHEKLQNLLRENSDLVIELTKLQEKLSRVSEEKEILSKNVEDSRLSTLATAEDSRGETETEDLKSRVNSLTTENNELIIKLVKLEEKNEQLAENLRKIGQPEISETEVTISSLEAEIAECRKLIAEQTELVEEMKTKLSEKEAELEAKIRLISEFEASNISAEELRSELKESFGAIEEWRLKCEDMERKMEILEAGKTSIVEGLEVLQTENRALIEESKRKDQTADSLKRELDETIAAFEGRLNEQRDFIATQEKEINSLREIVKSKDEELREKYLAMQNEMISIDTLQDELNARRDQLNRHEATIATLNEEIVRLNSLADSDREEKIAAQTEINVLREELKSKAAKEARNEELSRQLSDKESLADEMKTILNEKLEENAELRGVLETANGEVARLRVLLEEKENELQSMDAARLTLETDLRNLRAENAKLENDFHEARSSLDGRIQSNDDLQAEVGRLETLLNDVKVKYAEDAETQRINLETLGENLSGKNAECETLRKELENLSAELAEKTKFVEDLSGRSLELEKMRGELAEKEKMIGENVTEEVKIALELRVKELELRLEEAEANTQTQLKKRKILAANLKKKSSEAAELETRATQLGTKFAELEENLSAAKNEKEAANSRIREMQNVIEDKDRAILQLEEQLMRAQREAKNAGEKVEELAAELGGSTERINAAMDEMNEMGEEIEKLQREIEVKSMEIERERNEKAKIIADYDSCRQIADEVEKFQREIERERSEKAKIIADYDSCRQIADEVENLRKEIEVKSMEIEEERNEKAKIIADYDSCRQIADEVENLRKEIEVKSMEIEEERNQKAKIIADYESCRQIIDEVENLRAEIERERSEKAKIFADYDSCRQIADEVNKLRAEIELKTQEVEAERTEKSRILADYDSCRQTTTEISQLHSLIDLKIQELETEKTEKAKILADFDSCRQIADEVENLRTLIDLKTQELEIEKTEKAKILADFDSCRKKIADEETQRQQVLDEAKEKARELGVRMQVMETEYVDQLNTIQTLRTENGMLVSKQAQISERLENAEKEAAERKTQLERLQREPTSRVPRDDPSIAEEDRAESEGKAANSQPCDHCDQCQTVVQALEAKLQERDAEIENLDNELANSIGNFVHMRESLRVSDLMNQSSSRNRSLEEARDNSDLVFQLSALQASSAEIRDQLAATTRENRELREKIESLEAGDGENRGSRELMENSVEFTTLTEKCETMERELQAARSELETARQLLEERETGTADETIELRAEIDRWTRRAEELESEIEEYRRENPRLKEEIEGLKSENARLKDEGSTKTQEKKDVGSASAFFEEKAEAPQLFDAAKLFGLPVESGGQREIADLRGVVAARDAEKIALDEEAKRLREELRVTKIHAERADAESFRLQSELTRLELLLADRNRQIDALNSELNNVGVQLAAQFEQQGGGERLELAMAKLRADLEEREIAVKNLETVNFELESQLRELQSENLQYSRTMDLVSTAVRNLGEADKIVETPLETVSPLPRKLGEILEALIGLRKERSELMEKQETLGRRISALEIDAENAGDAGRIQELEERVDRVTRERDVKQLQVNDLTRAMEEMRESATTQEESRLRSLQAALDEAISERERLRTQLEATTREESRLGNVRAAMEEPQGNTGEPLIEHERSKPLESTQKSAESAQTSRPSESQDSAAPAAESGWDDDSRLDGDEEIWSWRADDAAAHEFLAAAPLRPSVEITLKTRIAELEDSLKDLEADRAKLAEDARAAQARSAKLVKKLKEFKIHNEGLQQQLKIQKSSSGFGDLDSAIEEELKSQIAALEKSLSESREDHKKAIAERDNLAKRLDVLGAANERLVEMKERQDMEVEVLQIRAKDLANKLQAVEWRLRETCGEESAAFAVAEIPVEARQADSPSVVAAPATPSGGLECLCRKYREEIDELRDEMEALAAENEQLQRLLEEQRATRQTSEAKYAEELSLRDKEIESLARQKDELKRSLDEAQRNLASLQESCAQGARNSDEETAAIRKNHEALKIEIAERTNDFETRAASMRREIEAANSQMNLLQEHLETLARENRELAARSDSHEETKAKLLTLSESMEEVTELLNSRVQEVAELKREIQRLKSEKTEALDASSRTREADEYLRQCEARIEENSSEISSLREKLAAAETEIASSAERLNEMIQENRELRESLEKANHDVNAGGVRAENLREEIERLNNSLTESRMHREWLQSELAGREQQAYGNEEEARKRGVEVERLNEIVARMEKSSAEAIEETNRRIREAEERETSLRKTIDELTARESDALAEIYKEMSEKDGKVATLQETILGLERKIHEVANGAREKGETAESAEGGEELRTTVERLREELRRKNEEIEDYRYQLSESTYPSIIQALQDQVNRLYEEKAQVEEALNTLMQKLYGVDAQSGGGFTPTELALQEAEARRQAEMRREVDSLQNSASKSEETFVSMLSAKDTEIRELRGEIEDKAARFRELHDHYESAMVEINELRVRLASKEEEVRMVRMQLEATSKEMEILRRAASKEIPGDVETSTSSGETTKEQQSSNELDLALYMLHQRDVRVEELTHELMQLLEERDTLQLRLSNAIRVNEELRRSAPAEGASGENVERIGDVEPLVEQPSPSRSVGPVEIAKEAIDSPSEEKVALAQKLSQLHNMGHRRDVRLMDDRELRHNQQMNLLAHRDVLSSLPPEAAARLVNANYTLSRDVQSQSSVLMNWLWGKSTPKVVHM